MKKLLSVLVALALVLMPIVPVQASYFNAITQKVVASTNNNYTAPAPDSNIASGATVTRTGESTLNVAGIQVNFIADQNFTIYVDQSMDNSNWDITDSYKYLASTGTGNSWTVQATASYFRVRMKNTGTGTTTYVRMQTALCPIVEAVPRSLDSEGAFKVCVQDIEEPATEHKTWVGEVHDIRANPTTKLSGSAFSGGTKDTNFWVESAQSGSGAVSQTGGTAILTTGATAASTIRYATNRVSRWIPGQENTVRVVAKLDNITTANVIRNWGLFDANNGAFFQLDGSTLNVVYRANAGDTATPKASWNVDNSFTLDTNYHIYEVRATYAGIFWYIDNTLVHKLTLAGAAALYTQNLSLPVTLEANKTSGATVCTLTTPVAFAYRAGVLDSETTYKYINSSATTVCKYTPGRLKRIIVNYPHNGAQTITVVDNNTGSTPVMALFTIAADGNQNSMLPYSIEFDCPFNTGLTIITNTTNPVTVIYE